MTNPSPQGDAEVVLPFSRLARPQIGTEPVVLAEAASEVWLVHGAETTQLGLRQAGGSGVVTVDATGGEVVGGVSVNDWTRNILANARPAGTDG